MAAAPANPLWEFSLALYDKPGVAPALIGLQDRLGLDVNMLLLCSWAGSTGRALSAEGVRAIESVVEPWQAQVVRPLRAVRRLLKGGFPPLPPDRVEAYRQRIGALELDGERLAQDAMAELVGTAATAGESGAPQVAANMRSYLQLRSVTPAAVDESALEAVVRACFSAGDR